MSRIDRRQLLSAAPVGIAAVVAGAAPVEALTIPERFALLHPEDQAIVLAEMDRLEAKLPPVQRAYGEWKRSLDAWNADMERDSSDENGDRWCDATYKLADAVVSTPSTGPMDFVYKMMAYCFNGQHELSLDVGAAPLWAEARSLVGV